MRRIFRLLTAGLALTSVVASGAQRPVRINLGTLAPRGSSYHQALQKLAQEWRKSTNGAVRLVIYTDGSQGSEEDMVRLMRLGALQAGLLTVSGLKVIEPSVTGLQNMPLVFRSLDEFDYVFSKLRPELEARMRAQGFETLFWADSGWIRFFSVDKAITPDDFSKEKLFVWSDPKQVEIMRAIGQNPVSLETADIPAALQTGLITAAPLPPILALSTQVDRKANHMLKLNYAPLLGAAVVTTETWSKIPIDKRAELLKEAQAAGATIRERSREESDEAVKAMQARGLIVEDVPPEAQAEWEAAAARAYPMIRGSLVPADVFDQVMSLVHEYRESRATAK